MLSGPNAGVGLRLAACSFVRRVVRGTSRGDDACSHAPSNMVKTQQAVLAAVLKRVDLGSSFLLLSLQSGRKVLSHLQAMRGVRRSTLRTFRSAAIVH